MQGNEPGRGVEEAPRRRRRHDVPISVRRSILDWVAISLLLLPSLVGINLFGAVRLWSICPLMFVSSIGLVLFFLRPFFGADLRQIQIPPGGVLWFMVLVYEAVMVPRGAVPYDGRIEILKLASYVGAFWAWSELARTPFSPIRPRTARRSRPVPGRPRPRAPSPSPTRSPAPATATTGAGRSRVRSATRRGPSPVSASRSSTCHQR